MSVQSFQFGGFSLDLARMGLLGPAGPIALRPKTFDVLSVLVARAGHVVSKDELMAAVWPDVTVTGDSLSTCISELRRALGDDTHSLIKTVSKRGYRLDAPVTWVSAPAQADAAPMHPRALEKIAPSFAPAVRSADLRHDLAVIGLLLVAAGLALQRQARDMDVERT